MQASFVSESATAESLQYGPVAVPQPGAGEVLIRVRAASLDRVDSYLRRGTHGMAVRTPTVLGRDMAGTVVALGPGVTGITEGDEVVALGRGTHAEFAVAPALHTLPRPADWTDAQAAALPTAGRTAYDAVANLARVRPGETVLVIAAGGAVGTFAVQYARALGARVLATAGSADKRDAAVRLGAETAFDHYADDLVERLTEQTAGAGVEVVIESAGGELWTALQSVLARGGRMVTCGVTAGARANIHLGKLMVNGWRIHGIGRPGPAEVAAHLRDSLALSRSIARRPVVDRVYALSDASAAHDQLESSQFFGRIVLAPAAQ